MPSKRVVSLALGCATGLGLLLSGCGGTSGGPGAKAPLLFFVNACPDGSVKFLANDEDKSGTLAVNGFTGLVTLSFIAPEDGAHDISLEEPDRSTQYDLQAHFFDKDTTTIYIACGLKNPASTEMVKRLKQTFFVPDRTAPIGNRARIFFAHAFNRKSPFGTPSMILKTTGDQPLFQTTPVSYGSFVGIDVDSGTYKFFGVGDVRNNYLEVKDPDNDQIYAENKNPAKPIVLAPGGLYLVMIGGLEAANSAPGELRVIRVPALDP